MKIINTTKNDIKVSILGKEYHLEPEGELEGVDEAAAEYWVTKLHQFLIVEPEDADKKPAIGSVEEEAAKAGDEKKEEVEEKKEEKKETPKKEVKKDK